MRGVKWALAALWLASAGAQAQALRTFDEVLGAAQAGHPAIQARRSEQAAAQAAREGAEWARYPTPSIEAAAPSSGGSSSVLRLDQPLWNGGRIEAGIAAAGHRANAAAAGVDESRIEIALRTASVYLEALRQQGRLRHAGNGLAEHERLMAMIRRRVGQEVSSQTDQRLAESRLQLAQLEVSQSRQALRVAQAQLAQLAGAPVADVRWDGLDEATAPATLEAALDAALAHSPTLRRLALEEQAAEATIIQRRSAWMPQLSLRLERSTGGTAGPDHRAMVVLQAQPGAGLSALSGVQEAVARREGARLAREAAERDLREAVTLDWEEWQAARQRREAARLSSATAAEVFASFTRQYVIGRKSWLEVLNAVREATQADYLLEDARAQAATAALRLRARTGMLSLP